MEAFLLPVASYSNDSLSLSLSEGAGSVCVGDADAEADHGAFFLDCPWAGGLAGTFGLVSPTCLLDEAVTWNFWGWAFIVMALSMSSSGSPLCEDGS